MKPHLFRVTKYGVHLDGEFVKRTAKMTFYRAPRSGHVFRSLTEGTEVVVETRNATNLHGKAQAAFRSFNARIAEAEKVLRDLKQNQMSAARVVLEGECE